MYRSLLIFFTLGGAVKPLMNSESILHQIGLHRNSGPSVGCRVTLLRAPVVFICKGVMITGTAMMACGWSLQGRREDRAGDTWGFVLCAPYRKHPVMTSVRPLLSLLSQQRGPHEAPRTGLSVSVFVLRFSFLFNLNIVLRCWRCKRRYVPTLGKIKMKTAVDMFVFMAIHPETSTESLPFFPGFCI